MNRRSVAFSAMVLAAGLSVAGTLSVPRDAHSANCGASASAGVDWAGCVKKSLMLPGNDFQNAKLAEADFSFTDLSRNNLSGADLEKARLIRAWFTNSVADKANFSRAEGYRMGFQSVSAKQANFESAELQRATFTGAILTDASFEKAELGRAAFDKADLTGVDFTLANLSRADLSAATFTKVPRFDRAFMFLTRIEGLDLSAATDLQQEQIDLTCGDAATKLPAGLKAPATWPCEKD